MKKATAAATARTSTGKRPSPSAVGSTSAARRSSAPAAAASPATRRGPVVRPAPKAVSAAPPRLSLVKKTAAVRQLAPAVAPPPAPAPPTDPVHVLLLAKRRELTGNFYETKFDTLAKMGRVADDDQAQMSHEEYISLQRNGMDYQTLRQVNAAIDRVQSGDYGICAACEEPISEKRLKAIPWAKYCIVCQDRAQANGASAPSGDEDDAGESW